MRSSLLVVAAAASFASTALADKCAAQNIVDACVSGYKARIDACNKNGNDWICLCDVYTDVLTCYNNCPDSNERSPVSNQVTSFCTAAEPYVPPTFLHVICMLIDIVSAPQPLHPWHPSPRSQRQRPQPSRPRARPPLAPRRAARLLHPPPRSPQAPHPVSPRPRAPPPPFCSRPLAFSNRVEVAWWWWWWW